MFWDCRERIASPARRESRHWRARAEERLIANWIASLDFHHIEYLLGNLAKCFASSALVAAAGNALEAEAQQAATSQRRFARCNLPAGAVGKGAVIYKSIIHVHDELEPRSRGRISESCS